MHIEGRLFEFISAFFFITAIVYGFLTDRFGTGGIEWAGTTALALTGAMAMITATFLGFVARRVDVRPEDYEEAEVSDGAGELGFFSPHSWWPILCALAFSIVAVGIALWLPWLFGAGIVMVIAAAGGLVFEYYLGAEKH
ncbi:cytochrome c oxidase subunit 4 [Mycolicibacillus trivialis]|uniref:Cytochrome c oxidase polypeptide 4 n=1 Tax=Mycolicibacillus trivialis TaxID=1798 RepID=A0A1X2EJ32_9MYCO|nr:cytochrome c oxidase subunit 4 [Mycolicibacillus trivialis]ORX03432.1 cytochrome C oxidase subunit IV [Mycolicibacillus trivialis]